MTWLQLRPSNAFRIVLAGGFLLMLAANLPGHLSLDSVVALHEGRFGVRETWSPAVVSWLLGRFDAILRGTGLFVTASALVLYVSLASLSDLRPRTAWTGPVAALAIILTPQLLLYQGIVWKDVLFANLAVAGFVCLAHAANRWGARASVAPLIAAGLCLSLAALVRQNGLIAPAIAALVLVWLARGRGWRLSLAVGAGAFVAVMILAALINSAVQPRTVATHLRPDAGLRVLQHYDLVGAAAHDPALQLDVLARTNPQAAALIRREAVDAYSGERIDTLDIDPLLRRALWRNPDAVIGAQWRDILKRRPGPYLAHRLEVFRWVLLTPEPDRCLPIHVGVSGPAQMLRDLQITADVDPADQAVASFARRFVGSPVLSHATYAALAVVLAAFLLWRRDRADVVVAAMQVAALGFAASFFVISVACDYRYLYFLDLAALTGLAYVALDPRVSRSRAK